MLGRYPITCCKACISEKSFLILILTYRKGDGPMVVRAKINFR